jgi:hypothetical protein
MENVATDDKHRISEITELLTPERKMASSGGFS